MRPRVTLLLTLCVIPVSGCIVFDSHNRMTYEHVAGFRWHDGQLQVTTWGGCRARRVEMTVEGARENTAIGRWNLRSGAGGRAVPTFTYGTPVAGFHTDRPTGADVDDPRAREVWVTVDPGAAQTVDHVSLGDLRAEQPDHPGTEVWYVNGHGWYTTQQLRARDDGDHQLLPLCEGATS